MILPTICPICQAKVIALVPRGGGAAVPDVFVCETFPTPNANNHFWVKLREHDNQVQELSFEFGGLIPGFWFDVQHADIQFLDGPNRPAPIPFFEPDLSDMPALLNKLKLYLLMS